MASTSKANASQNELARRGVLAHAEHVKSLSEALSKAVDTYLLGHTASDAVADWRDEFSKNVSEASKEFHRTLARSSKKVADVYFGEDEPSVETKPTTGKKGASSTADI